MRALVTGGGGFLGSAIARMLHGRGDEVTVLGRNRYPHVEREGIRGIQGDLRDPKAVERAAVGMDVVFHVGAIAAVWGPRSLFWDTNVGGTRNVLAACRAAGVSRLVYTSTPSVVFGRGDLCGVDESTPYPDKYLAHYPASKAIAEREVLAANGPELSTVALRPHLIWGPGDPHLIPRVLDRAARGRLVQIGDGRNQIDITYIDNAAEAHVLAADRLRPGAACAGRAYFISQGNPVALWPWLGEILS
ncbi:MAG: NAD-dependent epimerase/dehydratase family protein, partial [bacterium]|nr:NAD-dependent epimerase/dehydratase family protein [bacterium]